MIDYKYQELFTRDNAHKQFIIRTSDGLTITNEDLHSESIEIDEKLNTSEFLQFGSCEASSITFTVSNVFQSLKGKTITVDLVIDGHSDEAFRVGTYIVDSDKLAANRNQRQVIAYDLLYTINNKDVSTWYNSLPATFTCLQLRNSFFSYLNINHESKQLVNDSIVLSKDAIDTSNGVLGKTIISSICEMNGCFGHIGRDNRFRYVFLGRIIEGLYPSVILYPDPKLYPSADTVDKTLNRTNYMSVTYEDYEVADIDGVTIFDVDGAIGAKVGIASNSYLIDDNPFVIALSPSVMTTLGTNLLTVIKELPFKPSTVTAQGNLCIEVGDSLRFNTYEDIVYSYVLQRRCKGLQVLTDYFEAKGEQYRIDDANSIDRSIKQLQKKTSTISNNLSEEVTRATNSENGIKTRVGSLEADHVKVKDLDAVSARVQSLEADHVSVGTLNAVSAKVNTIEANYITASTVSSTYATITSLNGVNAKFSNLNASNIKSGTLSADRIDVDSIASKFSVNSTAIGCRSLTATNITCSSRLVLYGKNVGTRTVGGVAGVLVLTE